MRGSKLESAMFAKSEVVDGATQGRRVLFFPELPRYWLFGAEGLTYESQKRRPDPFVNLSWQEVGV